MSFENPSAGDLSAETRALPFRVLTDPRVVLIHPPAISKRYLKTKFMPYGMAVLTAFLKEHGVPVVQYDFLMEYLFAADDDIDFHNPDKSFSEEDFFGRLRGDGSHPGLDAFTAKYGGRIVLDAGMYAFSIVAYHQFWASLLLATHIRRINPSAIIVFGGPFITIKPPESVIRFGVTDYVVRGSGEIPLLMIRELHQGRAAFTREDIPGIAYSDAGRLFHTDQARLPAEQERLPDFEGLGLDQYRYDHPLTGVETLFLPYRISKGCPSRCSFCTGRLVDRYDVKPVEKIVSEIMFLSERYQAHTFQLADASVNGSPAQLARLCEKLRGAFPQMRWYSYAKVNGFTRDLLRRVRQAGCFSLFWGIESMHEPTVRLLGKRFDPSAVYDLIDAAVSEGIKSYLHLIYNAPHESDDDVHALMRLMDRYIEHDLVAFLPQRFLLEPGSLMAREPERYGLRNLRAGSRGLFERESLIFDEADGTDHEAIQARNESRRRMFEPYLEKIDERVGAEIGEKL